MLNLHFALALSVSFDSDCYVCRNPGITNQGVASLSRLRNLVSLDLSDCNSMSDPSLLALSSGLPLLQELSLHNCAHITDTGIGSVQ